MTREVGERYRSIDAPQQVYTWRGHQIAYYVDGSGPPLLLVHSINAAASAFEMRGPFFGQRAGRRVYAIDLLGYGGSDRPNRRYSAADFIALIADFQRDVVGAGGAAVASSLGAAYTIRAAAATPGLFGPLVLICPTGVSQLAEPSEPGVAYGLLRGRPGDLAFAALTSRRSTRLFLEQQAYYDKSCIDETTLRGFYDASHQPGAKYAPICFVSQLLNCSVADAFGKLAQPILLVWGKQGTTTPPSKAQEFLALNPQARSEVVDGARLLVQDEHPEQFNALLRGFLDA
jgi:pimeloyl-ACP methyl ester carboxylesterase